VFTRYLTDPLNLPSQGNNSLETNSHELFSVTDRNDVTVTGSQKVTLEPKSILGCDAVTDKTLILRSVTSARNEYEARRF
jgi:hypothetical protein